MQNIKKLEMQTPNKVDENIENILKLFPNVATEKEGKKVVDFDMLRQMLSDKIVEGDEERYRLDWVGKKASLLKANSSINKTLRPCKEESVDFDNTQNLYIEGDNFEVLKLLSESYLNKIKMIYIDPPYNTGKDFVYRDNFTQSKADFEDEIGMRDEEGNKLFKNTDSNGRFHSDWLSMMYERLLVARDLLKEDGVIFISIDDNEVHNLRKICDEVFGEGNFISELVWRKKSSGGQHSSNFLDFHEYILVYSKSVADEDDFFISRSDKQLESFKFEDEHVNIRGKYLLSPLKSWLDERKTLVYPITCPDGSETKTQWVCSELTYFQLLKENRIVFKQNSNGAWSIYKKQYSDENGGKVKPQSLILDIAQTQHGKREIKELFDDKDVMSFPKPLNLLLHFINMINLKHNDIILDFFSGSATTAHAVMQLNAEDGGNRKFIMVQLPEATDEKSEAYKAGYKNICEIGKERIRRAGAKITQEIASAKPRNDGNLDIGFRVLKIDTTNFKDVYYHPNNLTQKDIFDFQTNIKEERTDLDLLFQIMLDLGIELSLKITPQTVDGTKLYMLENNELIACLEDAISQAAIQEIKKHKPYQVVLKDGCFTDDNDKINALQELANITTVSVI